MHRRLLVAGLMVSAALLTGSSAWAATYPNGGTPPTTVQVEAQTAVAPTTTTTAPASSGSSLPFTGGDVATLTGTGVAAIGLGAFLTRRSRRRA
jgi:hypothetical protein